jgi:prepilin-type N-terminal cleavage/methylation domain-containing protein
VVRSAVFEARRAPDAHEGGFTLIELLVSLTVMAIGVVGIIGVMSSSAGVVVKTNQRARGTNLATETIEAFRAIPYAQLSPASTTSTTVKTVKGTVYTVSKGLTWASDGSTPQAYKQATVSVTWTDRAGFHDVRQSTLIFNGDDTSTTSTTTSGGSGSGSCAAPNPPTNLIASTPLNVSGTTGVDVNWTPPSTGVTVAYYRVQWALASSSTWYTASNALQASITGLRVNGLSSGTAYQFRVQGLSLCGATSSWTPVATATTETAASILCIPGVATITPTSSGRSNNGNNAVLSQTPVVSLNTSGTCTSFTMKYSPRSGVVRTAGLSASGSLYSGPIGTATSEQWDVGPHSIDIYDSINVRRASVVLTVCEKNTQSC